MLKKKKEREEKKKLIHTFHLVFFSSPFFVTLLQQTPKKQNLISRCGNATQALISNTRSVFFSSRGRAALRPSGGIPADTLIIPPDISAGFFSFFFFTDLAAASLVGCKC